MTSPKQIIRENQVIFPNDKQSSVTINKIFTPDEFHNHLKTLLPSNLYLHMNISSLSCCIDDLKSLIRNCQVKPKTIGISECRLKNNLHVHSDISIEGYTFEYTTTESSKGETLIYIDNNINYKVRNDLKIYKSKEIESTFIENIEAKSKKQVIACIYKHPKVCVSEFTNNFLNPLLENLATEKKEIIQMGDYKINILICNSDNETSDFIDTMHASSFYPTINTPTQITATSKTLIDNIFYNTFTKNMLVGNIAILYQITLLSF